MAMTASYIAPPPGLETYQPAKIEVESTNLASNLESQGEWANAVLSIAPFLNSEGIHKALAIIDEAIKNAQQAKSLDAVLAQAPKKPAGSEETNIAGSPKQLRKQVGERQRQLLRDLQALSLSHGAGQAQASAPAYPTKKELGGAKQAIENKTQPLSPEQQAGSRQTARQVQTLSSSLQLLSNVNPDCLFIVRRINKLGFKAARTLKKHFSMHGVVLRVLVAHSTVRQHGDPQCQARRRPSSLGFVQMSTKEAVDAILAQGSEQEVDGSLIRVQKFERQHAIQEMEEAGGQDDKIFWERQCSGSSSTTAPMSESGPFEKDENGSVESDDH